jgi:hypothetical protein
LATRRPDRGATTWTTKVICDRGSRHALRARDREYAAGRPLAQLIKKYYGDAMEVRPVADLVNKMKADLTEEDDPLRRLKAGSLVADRPMANSWIS